MKVKKISLKKNNNFSKNYSHKNNSQKNSSFASKNSVSKDKEKASYKGEKIYVGLDVHKKSWKVAIWLRDDIVEVFSQNSDPEILLRHLKRFYAQAEYYSAYEAGFCSFWVHRALRTLGIRNIVVNAADIPTKDKERQNKTDPVDARKLARELSKGNLEAIHVPSEESQGERTLLRTRSQFTSKMTRCKNQIKGLLNQYGIKVPEGDEGMEQNWSGRYIDYLGHLEFKNKCVRLSLDMLLEELQSLRSIILKMNREIRKLSRNEKYGKISESLHSIRGISTTSGMMIATELDEIRRFRDLDGLSKYVGLVPSEHSSGEREKKGSLSKRKNNHLRKILIEISWVAVRYDGTLKSMFLKYQNRMNKKKAIIKIARHVLSRIMYVLRTGEPIKMIQAA
ncbi:MAG: IS110 family transposase [Ignavibacteriales bacterium]